MLNVMLVDDEKMALEGLQILIDWQKHGFQVCALCQSGREALSRFDQAAPDLVVTDLYMPDVDGLQLMERLRERGYTGQLMIVSGYADFEKAQRALRHGIVNYLLKPIDPDEADKAIAQVRRRLTARQPWDTSDGGAQGDPGVPSPAQGASQNAPLGGVSETVKRLARQRMAENLTLEALAALMGYNADYLGRAFHEETGVSFRRWLGNTRMATAARMLCDSGAPVRAVAAAVGYRKYQNFLQAFKARYRLSPQEYRKQEQNPEDE